MGKQVQKEVEVVKAEYAHDARSIALQVKCEEGQFVSQVQVSDLIPNITNLEQFEEKDMRRAVQPFCDNIVGKNIKVVFDPDLNK